MDKDNIKDRSFYRRLRGIQCLQIVDRMDDLQGPTAGKIRLPLDVYWGPRPREYNLEDKNQAMEAYKLLLQEGTSELIKKYINKNRLIEYWPDMILSIEVVQLWHGKFPELHGNMVETWQH